MGRQIGRHPRFNRSEPERRFGAKAPLTSADLPRSVSGGGAAFLADLTVQ
jgi:hypothetical protein